MLQKYLANRCDKWFMPEGAKQTGIRHSVTDMGADRSTFTVQADLHPCLSHMVTILSLPG